MVAVTCRKPSPSDGLRKIISAEAAPGRVVKIPQFGTTFSLNALDKYGQSKKVPIVPTSKPDKFLALFENEDVDFEIVVDNSVSFRRHVGYEVQVHQKAHRFTVSKNKLGKLRALETRGRKLHFLRKSSEEGETFIATFAAKHAIPFKKAARILSQLKFEVDYSKTFSADTIDVKVNAFDGKKFVAEVLRGNTVKVVKEKIEKDWGFKAGEQRLIFGGRLLNDEKVLGDYGFEHGDEVHMVRELHGGKGNVYTTSEDEITSDADSDVSVVMLQRGREDVGERGVIVLGEKSNEEFMVRRYHADTELGVAQFVLELRMATPYGFSE